MAPPRRVSRGNGEVEGDPERENRTQARAQMDPERENKTQARAPQPVRAKNVDPERNNKTQARAQRPEEDYDTAGEYADDDGPGGAYRTGSDYSPSNEDLSVVPSRSLEGEGLDALDPEVGSATRSLPALERDEGDDDEVPAEADEANATRAGPPLTLEIIAGPDAGKKKKFKGVRMVVGRTPGVDLQLSDQSASRRHIELIYGDEGVLLKDLGSGNGTKVNGTKVSEKKLEHGDEIAIGKTKIRFVDDMAAFKQAKEAKEKAAADKKAAVEKKADAPAAAPDAEAPEKGEGEKKEATAVDKKPDRKRPVRTSRNAGGGEKVSFAEKFKALPKAARLGIVGGVAVLMLFLVLGIALRKPPPPPIDPVKLLADDKMTAARTAIRDSDFQTAAGLLADAEKLQPGIDRSNLAKQVQVELTFQNKLVETRKAIAEQRFEDAEKLLTDIGRASIKSEEEKLKVRAELDAAVLEYKKKQVEELLAAGELDAAKRLLGELPVQMQAEPAQQIAEFEQQLAVQEEQEKQDAKTGAARAAAALKARKEQEMLEALVVVERKFASAEWDRAASECARVMDNFRDDKDIYARARKLQNLIPSFGKNYDEGMKKFRAGQLAQAAKPLRQANQLYAQINLRANKFGQDLQDKLGAAAIVAGKEALIRDDLLTASAMFRDAVKFDPDDAKARQGLLDVAERAQDMFESAYSQRDVDPRESMRKFKIVVQVTDPGTTVHEKAKNQLAAMAP